MKYLFFYCFLFFGLNPMFGQVSKKNNFKSSESYYLDLLKNSPNDLGALESLGDLYSSFGLWNQALDSYKNLVLLEDNNSKYQFKYGGVLAMLAKNGSKLKSLSFLKQAKRAFDKAEYLNPNSIELYWAQIELYSQLPIFLGGDFEKAWQYSNKLEKLSKLNGFFAKAYISKEKNDNENFIFFTRKAIEEWVENDCINSNKCIINNNINYQIGVGIDLIGSDLEKALLYLKRYIQDYSPVDRYLLNVVYYEISQIEFRLGDINSALKSLDHSLMLDPEFEKAKEKKKQLLKL